MTAKEMFKELGYKQKENKYETIFYNRYEEVRFNNNAKAYRYITIFQNFVDVELHKAITKRLEELGWDNETN